MKKAVIIIWFGSLPTNFLLWLRSVSYNADYDFLFFTNQSFEKVSLPANFKPIASSLDRIRTVIQQKYGLYTNLKRAYKLCDFRPAYGELFEEELRAYDFWGYCDIDLMLGRLSDYITPDILSENKKVYIRGHFSLYRNEPYVNSLYRLSKRCDYKSIFTSDDNFIFDEWPGIGKIFREFGLPYYHEEQMADIDSSKMSFTCRNIPNYEKQLFVWEEGNVFQYYLENGDIKRRGVSYIHFQKRIVPVKDEAVLTSEKVLITNRGFYPHVGPVTTDLFYLYDRANLSHGISRIMNGIKKRFSQLFNQSPGVNRSLVYID